ncbi:MAG: tRNA (adenosine(37)-N6)-threonylcarbamoyltransferase complex ATPase subunit type 1 TsaE [Chlamydiia bacterium]|nr:tRNA (adenosine(37)-N6)-threonylcarbamoyltransferase complex ATPase subunit type 1 TsaE [Chlamydiia bacterium]
MHARSTEETIFCGIEIAKKLTPGSIVALFGDLGVGKTTLVKGIIHALTGVPLEEICSPTFNYLNCYEGSMNVYHFDLYRLSSVEDFLHLGFEEFFFLKGVCCIEWSERILPLLPEHIHSLTLKHMEEGGREIIYEVSERSLR